MPRKVGFVYSDVYLNHVPPGWHPENPGRLEAIMKKLESTGMLEKLFRISPRKATKDDLARVHTRAYIERVEQAKPGNLDPDTYVSEGSWEAALYAAGALLESLDRIKAGEIERAFCAVRPPGHHAEADHGMGFCLFNNIAVAARYAQQIGYGKVFIVDFDVHHGNATQHMFEDDPTVFFFSSHQSPHYPGTGSAKETGRGDGEGYTYNAPMRSGSNNKDYAHLYHDVLPPLMTKFDPDIVLVSAGYDLRAEDPLAGQQVTDDGLRTIIRGIVDHSTEIPYLFTLEGGYNPDALSESVRITLNNLLD